MSSYFRASDSSIGGESQLPEVLPGDLATSRLDPVFLQHVDNRFGFEAHFSRCCIPGPNESLSHEAESLWKGRSRLGISIESFAQELGGPTNVVASFNARSTDAAHPF